MYPFDYESSKYSPYILTTCSVPNIKLTLEPPEKDGSKCKIAISMGCLHPEYEYHHGNSLLNFSPCSLIDANKGRKVETMKFKACYSRGTLIESTFIIFLLRELFMSQKDRVVVDLKGFQSTEVERKSCML